MMYQIYFWLGLILTLCGVLTIVILCVIFRFNLRNRFVLLAGSDFLSTLITGLLLIGNSIHIPKELLSKDISEECSVYKLALKSAIFLLPILTGLNSIPSWVFNFYCFTKQNCCDNIQPNYDKKAILVVVAQWLLPIVSIVSLLTAQPEMTQIKKESFSVEPVMALQMGETTCNITDDVQPRSGRSEWLNTTVLTDKIVDRIYDIVIDSSKGTNGPLNTEHYTETDKYVKFMNNALTIKTTEANIPPETKLVSNNSTQDLAETIGNILASVTHNQPDRENQINFNTNQIEDIHKIITSLLTQKNDINSTETPILLLPDINILKLINSFTSSKNETNNEENCYKICQASKKFIRNFMFLMLFLNFFAPIYAASILQAMTKKNMELMEVNSRQPTKNSLKAFKFLGRTVMVTGLTLSPSFLEAVARSMLSIDMSDSISTALLILALGGMVIRNAIGISFIRIICHRKNEAIHPIESTENEQSESSRSSTTRAFTDKQKPMKQDVTVQDIEGQSHVEINEEKTVNSAGSQKN